MTRLELPTQFDFLDVFRTVWRRKMTLFVAIVVVTALSIVVVLQMIPRYTANTYVMIDTRSAQIVDLQSIIPALTADLASIETQIEIIYSRSIAAKVIDRLGLIDDAEFVPALTPRKVTFLTYLNPGLYAGYLKQWLRELGGLNRGPIDLEAAQALRNMEGALDIFRSNLSVRTVGRSYIISIEFQTTNPKKSARIANMIAEMYFVGQLEAKYEATQRATSWLNERVAGLRLDVTKAERAVAAYREKAGLIEGKGVTVTDQQLSELNSQLIIAQAARAEIDARVGQLRELLKKPGSIESAPEVLSSPAIQNLKQQETELQRREAEFSTRYRAMHPIMINVRAELNDLRRQIEVEIERVVLGLASEAKVAEARAVAMQSGLDKLRGQKADLERAGVRLRDLERDANAIRTLYETFLARLKETTEQEKLQQPDAQIVSRAFPPIEASFPRRTQMVGFGFGGSIVVGLVIILLLELLDGSFRSSEQVESLTGAPVLGLVPVIRVIPIVDRLYGRSVFARAGPPFHEAIRTINTAVALLGAESPAKVILITSSVPNEGKTLLSASMALQVARAGRKCLLVDGDFRRSELHKLMRIDNDAGLCDVLSGEKPFEEVVHRDWETGLDLITTGTLLDAKPKSPKGEVTKDILPGLFASERMTDFIAGMTALYDLVIIDAPPIMVVSDARALSAIVDKTIYAVRWGKTRRNVVLGGLKRLARAGTNLAGVVLTRVDTKKYARYGFADAGLYSKEYGKYY